MKTKVPTPSLCLLLLLLTVSNLAHAQSQQRVTRCFKKTGALFQETQFGSAVAANSQFIVSGDPSATGPAPGSAVQHGVVNVFSLTTGAFVRSIVPPAADASVANLNFGTSVALHGSTLVVGAPGSNIAASTTGAVYVYNVATGALIRKLESTPTVVGFGKSVAVHSGIVAVGSPDEESNRGAVYVFDLASGNPPARRQASDEANGDTFGKAVALSADWLLVGAPGDDHTRGSGAGAGYLFDAKTPFSQLRKLTDEGFSPSNPTGTGSALGSSAAIYGPKLFLGAPGDTVNGQTEAGGVYVFIANDTTEMTDLIDPNGASSGVRFGSSLVANDFLLAVGAPGSVDPVQLFEARDSQPMAPLSLDLPLGLDLTDNLGTGLALVGNRLIASTTQSLSATLPGALFKIEPILRGPPSAGGMILQQGNAAPGVPGAQYSGIDTNFFDNGALSSAVVSFATLKGPGIAGGTTKGVWNEDGTPFHLRRESLGSGTVLSEITSVQVGGGVAQIVGTRSGTGVNSGNNLAVFVNDLSSTGTIRAYTKGEAVTSLFGSVLSVFNSPVVSSNGISAIHGRLKPGGSLAINASNDTLISNQDAFSVLPQLGPVREGSTPLAGLTLAEIAPRLAIGGSTVVFASALTGDKTLNQALLSRSLSTGTVTKVARKGELANVGGAGTEVFSSFLGESVNATGQVAFRATFSGGVATAAKNEALFVATPGSAPTFFAVEGEALFYNGPPVSSFLSFRITDEGSVLYHAKLKGLGVTPANDQAVILVSPSTLLPVAPSHILVREGDPFPGNDRAIIGSILRVAYDNEGGYQVLVSLVNRAGEASTADNQAMLYGETRFRFAAASDAQGMRKPFVLWRKGWAFQQPGATTLKALAFSPASLAPSGASGTGRGEVIQPGLPLCTMQFTDNHKIVFRGGFNFD